MEKILKDNFGRIVNNLRISVTDRCNFRCTYCMPEEGMLWLAKDELLTFEEITRLTKIFSELGVTKIRLTGGEPLMRKDLHLLVQQISCIEKIKDIALTTNGFFLDEQAEQLVHAGVSRFTVSCDSLNPETFETLTRRNYLHKVFEALNVIEQLGIRPIKINTVLIRGINDSEIEDFVELARTKPYIIRFIEFMPIGKDDGWTIDKVVSTKEIIEHINAMGKKLIPLTSNHQPLTTNHVEPAERYKFEDGIGEIGFISSVSEPFCSSCNRVRITSDGKLRTCLFSLIETDLKFLLRGGAGDEEIKEIIINAVLEKEEGHLINQTGFVRPERTMSAIGG
ncbi:MAG: GTP 3',8-cyclase MoaA [Bacteroidetes bacterium]|nr:GTP 3',8-cyclase MoaA [Bacteroidota bacterium]